VAAALAAACALAWAEGSPLVPREGGRVEGDAPVFLALIAAAFAAYLAAVLLAGRRPVGLRHALALAVAVQLVPLAAPLLLSTDAWTYWAYGEVARAGGDPYADVPAAFPGSPALPFMGADWRDTTSVYGPAFTLASELVAAVLDTADPIAWLFKAAAAAALLTATWCAARLSRAPARAAIVVGWNPVLAVHAAGGGHNDAWVAALVLGALALGAAGRRQWAGVAWAAGILVKWVPAMFLALRALEARATRRRAGHAGFAVGLVVLAGLATWRYGLDWLRAFGPLADHAGEETSVALPRRLEQLGVPDAAALGLAAAALAVGLAALALGAARGRARLGSAALLLLATTPWLAVWYLLWAVPLAAVEDDRRVELAALALCAYLLPQAIPL
jgi:hypothetical protein